MSLFLQGADSRPFASLTATFAAWKFFLLAVALGASVGPDYDTSTSLFLDHVYGNAAHSRSNPLASALTARLTRWDALYFVYASRDGYVYEQQWAFGPGLPTAVSGIASLLRLLPRLESETDGVWEPLLAIAVAHVSHLVAVLALYQLTLVLCNQQRFAFVAAALHIFSPAGLFLSAPYAESSFSCLSFVGNLLFALGVRAGPDAWRRNVALVAAGAVFGLSCTFRSNGLFSGLLFAVETVNCLLALKNDKLSIQNILRLFAPVLGGIFVAIGMIVPQAIAWTRYCAETSNEVELRPWCSSLIPNIYTFVQAEYWDVGFLKYWTPNQLPLFVLAGPLLTILLTSGVQTLQEPSQTVDLLTPNTVGPFRTFVRTLAAIQTLLAVLAITNYHVQIITRLSSGYPVWYWWVAACLTDEKRQAWGYSIIVFCIMYAGIQGGLFASFLPPA